MEALSQVRAFAVLGWRLTTRGALRGGVPRIDRGQALRRLLFIALFLSWLVFTIFFSADRLTHLKEGRGAATGALLLAIAFFALAQVATQQAKPDAGAGGSKLVDVLPLQAGTRLALLFSQAIFIAILAITAFLGLAGERRQHAWPQLTILGLEYALLSFLLALLVCTFARAYVPAHRVRTILRVMTWFGYAVGYVGINATAVAQFPTLRRAVEHGLPMLVALPTATGVSFLKAAFGMALLGAAAYGLTLVLERRGIDPLTASPARQKRSSRRLDAAGVERLLLHREQQTKIWWAIYVLGLAASTALSFILPRLPKGGVPPLISQNWSYAFTFTVGYFGYLRAVALATSQTRRDLGARPLLATLPIPPAAVLLSKEPALRLNVMPVLTWLVPPLIASQGDPVLLWRSAVLVALLALMCALSPAIAFLNGGLGAPGPPTAGARAELLLIALPYFGALAATTPLTALPPLGAMALLTFEAHRAASRRVRWLDDAGDDLERETPVWRALLAFAVFMGLQALSGILLGFSTTSPAIVGGAAYLFSAAVLVLLTRSGREGLPTLRWVGTRQWALLLGLGLGGVTGLLGLQYEKLLERLELDVSFPPSPLENASPEATVFFAAVLILAAPIAEEMFFRGWLQSAIKVELPDRWKRLAFVLAAFAFASVHPGISFPIVFALGLVAGWLYELTGGILAGMCAHAAHNAVVTLLGQ